MDMKDFRIFVSEYMVVSILSYYMQEFACVIHLGEGARSLSGKTMGS